MNETGAYPRFRSLYRQSLPGSRINEDGAGLHGRHAWIIDGATGVSAHRSTPGQSDAAWLAKAIDEKLEALAVSGREHGEVLGLLETFIGEAFDEASARSAAAGEEHGPSACLGFIGIGDAQDDGRLTIESGFLGDVVALVPAENGVVRWTDERAKPFEKRTLAALSGAGREPGRIPEVVTRQILENRSRLNHPEGYWVVNPRRPWAGRELRFQAHVKPGQPIVLATDGFMRLVDVFGAHSDASLYAALAVGGGDDLVRELRERERGDPLGDVYPRVKTHDDATVLVIAAELED